MSAEQIAAKRLRSWRAHVDVVRLDAIAGGPVTETDLLGAARTLRLEVTRRAGALWIRLRESDPAKIREARRIEGSLK